MERHFGLPIALAAAVHVGLLFGIPSSPTRVDPAAAKLAEPPAPPIPDSDPLVVTLTAEPESAADAEPVLTDVDPPPVTPEPPQVTVGCSFVIEVPAPPAHEPTHPVVSFDDRTLGRRLGDGSGPSGRTGDVVDPGLLDNPPRTRLQVPPHYPPEKRQSGQEGEVVVEFGVDESGVVFAPRVVRSTDHAFDEPTLRAVARWRFEPGRRDGRVVRFRMMVPVVFRLGVE